MNHQNKILNLLQSITDSLQSAGIEAPRIEAQELIGHIMEISPMDLYHGNIEVSENQEQAIRKLVARRIAGEPVQYLLGTVDFLNVTLKVDRRVLIPRSETEHLADLIIKELKREAYINQTLLDLCTGSGCLAISIKKALLDLNVIASDLSPEALNLARENAERNEVEIEFRRGDFLQPIKEQELDYLVSNPPYIRTRDIESLQREVKDFEPMMALDGGTEGLDFYEKLAHELPQKLKPNGKAWLEIGYHQGNEIKALFSHNTWASCTLHQDLYGLDRYIFLIKK